jgi:hypothetical protein
VELTTKNARGAKKETTDCTDGHGWKKRNSRAEEERRGRVFIHEITRKNTKGRSKKREEFFREWPRIGGRGKRVLDRMNRMDRIRVKNHGWHGWEKRKQLI